jgi:glucokinase
VNALVADIGGTRIKLGIIRERRVIAQQSIAANSSRGLATQLPRIASVLETLCRDVGITVRDCTALAIAFPSLIDSGSLRVRDAAYGKYADAPQLDLACWCRETLGLRLLMEHDVRVALLGEWQAGAGRGSDDLVMVTLGTGLGTAVLIEGNLLRGKHGQAGVLGGHMTIQQNGRRCTCGNHGCAEAEASTLVLPLVAAEVTDFPASALSHCKVVDYAAVLRLAREGDACSIYLRDRSLEVWSSMIVNLVHAYDPERVIVGGGIMAADDDFFAELRERVLARANTPWGRVAVVPGQLGDSAALLGGEFMITQTLAPN